MPYSPLHEAPREQRAPVIRTKHETSLLDWLQANGRLISRDNQESDSFLEEEEEISGLIDPDDASYDGMDDDSDDDGDIE